MRIKFGSKILLILFQFLFITGLSATKIIAVDYYVSTQGLDTNPGTISSPWKTISKAASVIMAGDTAFIRGGTYNERVVINQRSGTAGAFITFQSYPGETPIIDGTNIDVNTYHMGGLVEVRTVGYIRIKGLKIQNSRNAGIFTDSASNLEIIDNHTNKTYSSGVGIWNSDRVLVSRNNVLNARYVDMVQGGHEESISIAGSTNFEVSYNEVSLDDLDDDVAPYLGNEGIDCKDGSRFGKVHHNYIHDFGSQGGSIYVDAWDSLTGNIDIYSNYLNNTAAGIVIGSEKGGTVENIRIYNNLIYKIGADGIKIAAKHSPQGKRQNIEIYNNTVYKARWNGGAGIYIAEPDASQLENIIIKNNIVYFNLYNGEIVAANETILNKIKANNNLVFGPKLCSQENPNCVEISDNRDGYPDIFGNITIDPKFIDLTTPDLHLQADSPAIDAGVTIDFITTDYDGNDRPQKTKYDVGALEYLDSTSTPEPTPMPGDANNDNRVDGVDYVVWYSHYNQSVTGPEVGDFNNSGLVDGVDYMIWWNNYGK